MSAKNTVKTCAAKAPVMAKLAVFLALAGCAEVNKSDWQNVDYTGRSVKSGGYNESID